MHRLMVNYAVGGDNDSARHAMSRYISRQHKKVATVHHIASTAVTTAIYNLHSRLIQYASHQL